PDFPETDMRLAPPPQGHDRLEPIKAAEREYRQWSWIQGWNRQIKEAKTKEELQEKLNKPPLKIPSLEAPASPPIYLSLNPKAVEGFQSLLIQILSGNGHDKTGGAKQEEPPAAAAKHPKRTAGFRGRR